MEKQIAIIPKAKPKSLVTARIDPDILREIQSYGRKHRMTVSHIISSLATQAWRDLESARKAFYK